MDALLAGYGSDSEESSSSTVKSQKDSGSTEQQRSTNSNNNHEAQAASLSGLLGAGVDSCSSSSDDEEEIEQTSKQSNPSDKCDVESEYLIRKRKKQCSRKDDINNEINDKNNITFLTKNRLPSPQKPSTISVQSSMISWNVDYISHDPPPPVAISSPSSVTTVTDNNGQFRKFEKLTDLLSENNNISWAAHLQNQQEFHNPHFFQSVIEHYGIVEPLGSQAEDRTKMRQSRFH